MSGGRSSSRNPLVPVRQAGKVEGSGACANDRETDPACEDPVTTTTTRPQPRPSPDGPRASRPAGKARPEPAFLTEFRRLAALVPPGSWPATLPTEPGRRSTRGRWRWASASGWRAAARGRAPGLPRRAPPLHPRPPLPAGALGRRRGALERRREDAGRAGLGGAPGLGHGGAADPGAERDEEAAAAKPQGAG